MSWKRKTYGQPVFKGLSNSSDYSPIFKSSTKQKVLGKSRSKMNLGGKEKKVAPLSYCKANVESFSPQVQNQAKGTGGAQKRMQAAKGIPISIHLHVLLLA